MTPTIGRIVHYRLDKDEPEINGSREFPAIITRVNDEDQSVSLHAFNDGQRDLSDLVGIKLLDADADQPNTCWWPERT